MAVASRARVPGSVKLLAVVIVLGLIFGLYRLVLHERVARHLQFLAHSIPGCTGVRYSSLSLPFFSLQARLQNIRLDFAEGIAPMTAETVHIRRFRPGTPFPRVMDATLDGIDLDNAHPFLPFGQALQDLGYATLRGDLHIQWKLSGENQEDWGVHLMLEMADMGKIALSFQLAKVNAEGVALALAQPYNWLLVLPAVELIDLQCDYRDDGLFDRAIRAAARAREQSPEAFREALQHRLQMQLASETDPRVQSVWQSLAAFCRQPGRIRLRTHLPRPIPLGQLWWVRRPQEFIQRLALESRAG